MNSSDFTIEIVLIDDGSREATAQMMQEIAVSDERYHGIFLARNHGHQLALSRDW